MIDTAIRMALGALQGAFREVKKNDHAWTYTIASELGSPYLTRTLLPRIGPARVLVHCIHRADQDIRLHNHPWQWARFLVVSGAYQEYRLDSDGVGMRSRVLCPGDVNALDATDFHRIGAVSGQCWTVGIVGPRTQEWGFRNNDGSFESFSAFQRRTRYETDGNRT